MVWELLEALLKGVDPTVVPSTVSVTPVGNCGIEAVTTKGPSSLVTLMVLLTRATLSGQMAKPVPALGEETLKPLGGEVPTKAGAGPSKVMVGTTRSSRASSRGLKYTAWRCRFLHANRDDLDRFPNHC